MTIPAYFYDPVPTQFVDGGYASKALPPLPYFVVDGGAAGGVSGAPMDGGNANYVEVQGNTTGGN